MGFCSRVFVDQDKSQIQEAHMDILALLQLINLSRHENTKTPAGDAGGVKKSEGVAPWCSSSRTRITSPLGDLEPSGLRANFY